ncbi:hypothetical protein ON021_33545, partial [Microcoleus sp. HI-ES]|nr:hypothetical protein [Microcoleus sp. HI-ES]
NLAIAPPKSDRTQRTIGLETKKAILISNSIASSGRKSYTSSIALKGDRGNFNLKCHISAAFTNFVVPLNNFILEYFDY